MKKFGFLICLLQLVFVLRGFTLDIYVNDRLWHSYTSPDLRDLRVSLNLSTYDEPGIPFSELIPLMTGLSSLRIGIPDGEILLDTPSVRGSYLTESDAGGWNLSMNSSVYHNPGRIDIYGTLRKAEQIRIWAEPGLTEVKDQIDVWAGLHKIEIDYKEVQNLEDELIHTRMAGDLMPDFTLSFLTPDAPLRPENTILYALQSILAPLEREPIDTLVTPSGFKLHPDLYLSVLASLHPGISPLTSVIMNDTDSHRRAVAIYADLIIRHRILEQNVYHNSEAYRNKSYAFFPSSAFPLQTGERLSLSDVQGLETPLSTRVLPLMLETRGEDFSPGTLLDFLKLSGIQESFLSSLSRQLPAEIDLLSRKDLTPRERKLLEEWRRGFILSRRNYALTGEIYRRLPDLLRTEGELP